MHKLKETLFRLKAPAEPSESPPEQKLAACLASYCKKQGLSKLFSIGNAADTLISGLEAQGVTVHSSARKIDFSNLFDDGSDPDRTSAARVGPLTVPPEFRDFPYLCTCFDLLHRIDDEHIADAIISIRGVVCQHLIVSVATKPSCDGNAYHSTVLPARTWKAIFEAAGFSIIDNTAFEDFSHHNLMVTEGNHRLLDYWNQAGIFKENNSGSHCFVTLSLSKHLPDQTIRNSINHILGVGYRTLKREAFGDGFNEHVVFNIHHFQDFLNAKPIFDVLMWDNLTILLRKTALVGDEVDVILGFCRRRRFTGIAYDRASNIPWAKLKPGILVSFSDTTVAPTHILAMQVTNAAKLHGFKTVILQHGIWIEPFPDRVMGFSSEYFCPWGDEQVRFLSTSQHEVAGVPAPFGVFDGKTIEAIGCSKYTDILLQSQYNNLLNRLSIDTTRYSKIVLLGTNSKWSAHKKFDTSVLAMLRQLIMSNKDYFFIVKLHPSERVTQYESLRAENTCIIDDILLTGIDVHISNIISNVDIIVSSLSTLLLDGAIAGKRIIQYATNNLYSYYHCEAFPLEDIIGNIRNPDFKSLDNVEFVKHYASADHARFYSGLRETFAAMLDDARSKPDAETENGIFLDYSLCVMVENLFLRNQELQRERREQSAVITNLNRSLPVRVLRRALSIRNKLVTLVHTRSSRAQ